MTTRVYLVFGNLILSVEDESVTVADVGTVTMKLRNGMTANISNACILPESEVFIHAVRTGDSSGIRSDYEDAYKTHEVTSAALESAMNSTPVKLRLNRWNS